MEDLTLHKDFWITVSAVAGTFAGFTLAGYSIYITRAEMAASDPVCRRYNYRESTSSYSLYFVLFVLMMFLAPLGLGLLYLSRLHAQTLSQGREWVGVITGMFICGAGVFWVVSRMYKYVNYGTRYYHRVALIRSDIEGPYLQRRCDELSDLIEEEQNNVSKKSLENERRTLEERKNNLANAPRRKRQEEKWKLLWLSVLHIISIIILGFNILFILGALMWPDGWYAWIVWQYIDARQMSVYSLSAGMTLICCYFYLFQPERFLFRKNEATERSLHQVETEIVTQCTSLEKIQTWLRKRIESSKAVMRDRLDAEVDPVCRQEMSEAQELLNDANIYVNGQADGLLNYLGGLLSEERRGYHKKWIDFCLEQEFITYEGILWIVNGIDMYVEGLNRFEAGLKELPGQLQLLTNPMSGSPTTPAAMKNPRTEVKPTARRGR